MRLALPNLTEVELGSVNSRRLSSADVAEDEGDFCAVAVSRANNTASARSVINPRLRLYKIPLGAPAGGGTIRVPRLELG